MLYDRGLFLNNSLKQLHVLYELKIEMDLRATPIVCVYLFCCSGNLMGDLGLVPSILEYGNAHRLTTTSHPFPSKRFMTEDLMRPAPDYFC